MEWGRGGAPRKLPSASDWTLPIAIAMLLPASLVGTLLATDVSKGIALVMALCYVPLVLVNVLAGVALWVSLIFLDALPSVDLGAKAAGLLIMLAWFASLRDRLHVVAPIIRRHGRLLGLLGAFIVYLTVSLTWAHKPSVGASELWQWYAIVALFVVLATLPTSERAVRFVIAAFVIGGILTVVLGAVIDVPAGADTTATELNDQRYSGASGDPNYLAAVLIPAMVLGAAFMPLVRNPLLRLGLVVGIVLMLAGFAATESRGGMIAVLVTMLAGLVVFKHRRIYVLAAILLLVGGLTVSFAASPGAWQRVTSFQEKSISAGNGREDLWTIAWRITKEHPLHGVGLSQFEVVEADYVQQPGLLKSTNFIVDKPHVAHNTYLQILAETGVIGLAMFVAFLIGAIRAAWLAGQRFERLGDRGLETLCHAVVVGTLGMLTALFFITDPVDKRLWLLLALGPALLAIATRRSEGPAIPPIEAAP
jgi:hypothetical protein